METLIGSILINFCSFLWPPQNAFTLDLHFSLDLDIREGVYIHWGESFIFKEY